MFQINTSKSAKYDSFRKNICMYITDILLPVTPTLRKQYSKITEENSAFKREPSSTKSKLKLKLRDLKK